MNKDHHWFDTGFVLVVDTAQASKLKFYLVYNEGGERNVEEPDQDELPKFCDGPEPFTVAVWKNSSTIALRSVQRPEDGGRHLDNIDLEVVSIKKPDLGVAGYKDANHPYIPVFPLVDN